jgi:hypothetical protein
MSGFTLGPVTVYQPQSIAIIDDSEMEAGNNVNDVAIGIIGQSTGGQPGVPLTFTTARAARKTLLGGELPQAIERMYNPGVQPGAYRVVAVRLDGDTAISGNLALQATLTLKDDGGAANAVVLTSNDYGTVANDISVLVDDPTTPGAGKDITVFAGGAEIVGVDVGAEAIQVQYTGTATAATVTVTATAVTTACTGVAADNQNILLATYNTLQKVVDVLNATGVYEATVTGLNPDAASTTLDKHTASDVLTDPVDLRADLQRAVDWFNSVAGDFVSAAKQSAATSGLLDNIPRTYLAGGRNPTITNNSWQQAFDVLSGVDCRLVAVVSGSATVHAMAASHCQAMSAPEIKKERRAILGGIAGETAAQAKARALALNDDRAQLVFPGILDDDGATVLAPYMVACQVAGISAGLRPGFSKTAKYIRAAGVERVLDEGTINNLEQNGVCVVKEITGKGFKIVHDQTTWLKDTKFNRREMATGMVVDRVLQAVRDTADARIGEVSGPETRNIIAGDIAATLATLTALGLLVGNGGSPPFRNISVRPIGDHVEISFVIQVGVPMNFVGIVIKVTAFNGA